MKTIVKAIIAAVMAALLLEPLHAYAQAPYEGYIYNRNQETPASLNGYLYSDSIDGYTLPIGPFDTPEDLFVAEDDSVYIVDSGNNRILRMDMAKNVLLELSEEEGPGVLNTPKGVFVTEDGDIYVADTGNRRIVRYDAEGSFVQEFGKPDSPLLGDNFIFSPSKVVVDKRGYLFVVSEGASQGLLQISPEGRFAGFFGANHVEWSLRKMLVRLIASQEQRQQMASEKPPEFSNLFADADGFYYTTTVGIHKNQVKRLSTVGVDILNNGFDYTYGDLQLPTTNYVRAFESFVDVTVSRNGIITALDSVTGKAFQYDELYNLLFVFGGIGDQNGLFQSPGSIAESKDGTIYIADKGRNRIDIFRPTPFGRQVHEASYLHTDGRYEEAKPLWEEVLRANGNYTLAYNGIGRALLKSESFAEAMTYFKLGKDKYGYSDALKEYRKEWMRTYFQQIAIVIVILFILIKTATLLYRRWRAKRGPGPAMIGVQSRNTAKLALRSLRHPIDFYEDYSIESRWKWMHALTIIACVIAAKVISLQITGFALQTQEPHQVSVLVEATWIIVPWLTWAVANWGVSTITDGEGKFVDIATGSAFALAPLIPLSLLIAALSNLMTLSPSASAYGINNVIAFSMTCAMYLWVGMQLFLSVKIIHDFEFKKTFGVMLLSVIGMFILWFIGLLLFGLINQFISFVISGYKELMFRQ